MPRKKPDPKFRGRWPTSADFVPVDVAADAVVRVPYRRGATQHIPSLTTPGGSASKATAPKYTGESMIGIATMHKSNSVPVFSKDQAEATAKMRR